MVGRNLIPNGSFLTYKRRRTRKKRGSRAQRGRSAVGPIPDASLSVFLSLSPSRLSVQV